MNRLKTPFILIAVLALSASRMLGAQTSDSLSTGRGSVAAMAVVGYNSSYRTFAGLDVRASVTPCKYFESELAAEILTPGTFSISASLCPGIDVGKGRFLLDGRFLYRNLPRYSVSEFAGGFLAGYWRQFFSVMVGGYWRNVLDNEHKGGSVRNPFELLYKFSVSVRPATSRWNISAIAANFTPYEVERMYVPIFFLDGRFDFTDRLTGVCEISLKPSGMFSMQATFFQAGVRAGASYRF